MDHRRVHVAVVTACPVPGHVVKRLLSFEVSAVLMAAAWFRLRFPAELVCGYFRSLGSKTAGS